MTRLFVCFATGHGRTTLGRATNAMIRLWSGSDLCHVYVGDEVSTVAHGRKWATDRFIQRFPNLASVVVVPCARAVVVPGWPCTGRAVGSLRASGVSVPRYLWTPLLLKQYLLNAAYTEIAIAGDSPQCPSSSPNACATTPKPSRRFCR